MLERITGKLLSRFLSKYFILPESNNSDGSTKKQSSSSSSPSKTQLAVWSGFLSFQHLQLRSTIVNETFQKKGLPFELSCGFVDRVEINVPWAQLRSLLSSGAGGGKGKNESDGAAGSDAEIVIVLDGIYLLINTRYEFHDDKLLESQRLQRRKELDAAMAGVSSGSEPSSSYFKSYVKNRLLSETFLNDIVDTLTNRIQVHVRNVHIRLEDLESDPTRPCCFGLTIESLHLTSEESDEDVPAESESNHTASAATPKKKAIASLEKILARKVMQVNQLSVYCNGMGEDDDNKVPHIGRPRYSATNVNFPEVLPLQTMSDQPTLLSRAMHASIPRRRARSFDRNFKNELRHTYLLHPIDATSLAVLFKSNNQSGNEYNKAKLRAETNITSFQLGINSSTIGHLVTFHARLKHHKSLMRHRFYRPTIVISSNPKQWWKYIVRVVRKELREAGNVRRGGWSWIRWHDRAELRKRYISLYERWLDHGVVGDDAVIVDSNESDVEDAEAESEPTPNITALSVDEFDEMRAIENGAIDDELSVSDVVFFRALAHSNRQKQVSHSSDPTVDSQYRLTRFLRRIVTSEDLDEEYTRLLSYLEKKEEEESLKRREEDRTSKLAGNRLKSSELCVVISLETIFREGSISLFSDLGRIRVFDVSLGAIQSKISVLENFDSVAFEGSVYDCTGIEHQSNGSQRVVFSRDINNGASDEPCTKLDKLFLPVDLNGGTSKQLQSHYDSPLFDVSFMWHPPSMEIDAATHLSVEKMSVHLYTGLGWHERCKEALSLPTPNTPSSNNGLLWEELSMAYINSWESTKKSLAAKATRALQKRRKIDLVFDIHCPIVLVSDGIQSTLTIDLGHAHIVTEQLAGMMKSNVDHHTEVTPKKTNATTPSLQRHSRRSSNGENSYLFTPNKTGKSSFLSPVQPVGKDSTVLDISSIFESPFDTSSLNGSIESGHRRKRGWSLGNTKLFSVAENEEATVAKSAHGQQELMKCFYDHFRLNLNGVNISLNCANIFELPFFQASIAKSTIPSDHSLCKMKVTCVVDIIRFHLTNASILGFETLLGSMKHSHNISTHNYYSGSVIFPSLPERVDLSDGEDSSVNEEEFLDAINEPDDANQWFDDHWGLDEESIGEFTYDASFAKTPSSRRHRFPSISEVSGEERPVYLSADNLLKLDKSIEQSRRLRSHSLASRDDDDSFHSAVSLDNQDELVNAIQDDIKKCEREMDKVKSEIQIAIDSYTEIGTLQEDPNGIKRRRHHKRKLKAQLLRLEAELNALKSCYRDIMATNPSTLTIKPQEATISDPDFDFQKEALDRAKALIFARKNRATSYTTSPTKNSGHHTLTTLNRDLLFISFTIASMTVKVSVVDTDEHILIDQRKEREILFTTFENLALSAHRRQIDTRIRIGLDRAFMASPSETVAQCGCLDERSIARRVVKIDEESFIRIAAESRNRDSRLKLKLKIGPVEFAADSFVDLIPQLTSLRTKRQIPKAAKAPSDVVTKLTCAVMGSSYTAFEGQKSHDIDLQLSSINISLADHKNMALFSVAGMNVRLARRVSPLCPHQSRGQCDFRVNNVMLHDLSKDDQWCEIFGCQSSFDQFLQGRIRVQCSQREITGGWCIEMDEPDTTNNSPASDHDELCLNLHIGIRCQSTILLVVSPEISRILGSAKSILSSQSEPNNSLRTTDQCHSEVTHTMKAMPIRWRVDGSMLECVIILPGKGYKYSSSIYYDAGSHLRVSSSLRLSIEPDPLKSGNVSVNLSSRSFVVLNASTNIVEPFILSFNVKSLPHILKIQPINTELGALDTPIAWATDDSTSKTAELVDGTDILLIVQISSVSFNLSPPLFAFLKEIQPMYASKQVDREFRDNEVSSTSQGMNISLALTIASVSMSLIDQSASSNCNIQLLIEAIRAGFVSDTTQVDTQISACSVGLFFIEDSTTMPIFYLPSLDNSRNEAFLFSGKLIKCTDDQAMPLKLSVKSTESYVTLIPSFIRQASKLLLEIKDTKRKESRITSQDNANSINLVQKVRRFMRYQITFTATSDGLHLVLPSQDLRQLNEQREHVLNTICLSWTRIAVTLTSKALEMRDIDTEIQTEDDRQSLSVNHFMSFKADIKADFGLTRTSFLLVAHIHLPVVFRINQRQVIVSPFSYSFNTSLIMLEIPNSNDFACSLGLHLDVGDVDILWHAASSSFGLSDALKVSVIPLFKNETPIRLSASSRQDFESLSLKTTSPIQHTKPETVGNQPKLPKLPEKVYLLFKDTMLVSSVRIASIQIVLVPSNSKEVSSPLMKLSITTFRTGASIMKSQSSGGMKISPDSIRSCLYFSQWLDFTVSAHYHNRRLVIYEPLVEPWAGNIECCVNVSDVFGMQPFEVQIQETGKALIDPIASDSNRLTRFVEGMKNFHRSKDASSTPVKQGPTITGLDLCHIIQCSSTSYVKQAIHPARVSDGINAKEIMLTHAPSSTNEVSVVFSMSNGKADHSIFPQIPPVPLNINITGALIENVALMISERSENEQVSPHYIINQTGLNMCWKVDKAVHSQDSLQEIKPGEQEELRIVGFPHRSFIYIELYSSRSTRTVGKIDKIDVDMVGVRVYDLKSSGNHRTSSSVIVRVQLVGTAKAVSIESPVWVMNASNLNCHLSLSMNGEDVFHSAVLPWSERLKNNMPENVIPLPVDVVAASLYEMYLWIKNTNDTEHQRALKMPAFKRSERRGLTEVEELSLPLSMYQNVSLRICCISSLEVAEQRLLVLQSNFAFRNHLPHPVVFEVRIVLVDEKEPDWLNIGQVASGKSIQFPLAKEEDTIECRIKIIDNHGAFLDWSSSACISKKNTNSQLMLSDRNGSSLPISIGVRINDAASEGSISDQMKISNAAYREVFIYVPTILIDNTGENLELMGNPIIWRRQSTIALSVVENFGGTGLSKALDDPGCVHMIGERSSSLSIRQSTQHAKSPWSNSISIREGKSHNRIIVPSSSSSVLRLCARIQGAPQSLGGKFSRVVVLDNKYSLINQLPIDIEVISTDKAGRSQNQQPLVIQCGKPSVPIHFDDRGFIRLRPKEIGWSYSGLVNVRDSNSRDIALRLRNVLTGKAFIVTIELNQKNGPAIEIVIRRSRAVPFRIENLSTVPLQFVQQPKSILSRLLSKWSDSTVLLPYHKADYAWDELEGSTYITIAVADLDFGQQPDRSTLLGNFHLDLLAPGAKVLSQHPRFKASVIADGPTRVLKITDSSLLPLGDGCAPSNTIPCSLKYECSICFDLGVSLIDWKPQELVYLFLGNLSLRRCVSGAEDIMLFSIRRVSADNCLWVTPFPTLFKLKASKNKNAVTISWSRDTNDALGKDITLLRHATVELGTLIFKIDGALIGCLVQMYRLTAKLLKSQAREEEPSLVAISNQPQQNQRPTLESSEIDTAASAAKVHQGHTKSPPTSPRHQDREVAHKPKHKYYIELTRISSIRSEISYCGRSLLPIWLNPSFHFEALPVVFSSFSSNHTYGSAADHLQHIKQHYNIWRLLLGLSLRPVFIARALIYTTRQSLSVITEQVSLMLRLSSTHNSYERSVLFETASLTDPESSAIRIVAAVILKGAKYLLAFASPETEDDTRTRAPRLFAKEENADVLLEYEEGENAGRAMLSRVAGGRYLSEGTLFHGELRGIGEQMITQAFDQHHDETLFFVLTPGRLLILKNLISDDTLSVLWDIELQSIVSVEKDELPSGKLALQLFHIKLNIVGLSMLSPKLLLFNDSETGNHVLECMVSINNRLSK